MENNNLYTVTNIDGAGRGLIAARDIRTGEIILKASPAGLGPQPSAADYPQCVECWKIIRTPYTCPRCRLPCCDFNCSQGKLHRIECDIFLQLRIKLQASTGNGVFRMWVNHQKDILASILPIRILSLKWRDPELWSKVKNMAVDKVSDSLWSKVKTAFDKFLYMDERMTECELKQVVGIQSTNGASLHFYPGHGSGVGVYPVQAFLNHDCRCNTETLEHPLTHCIEVYARTDISKGSQITTSYVNTNDHLLLRRKQLFDTWNFWCRCDSCVSRTGTLDSALTCSKRCPSMVLPTDTFNPESEWKCLHCDKLMNPETVWEKLEKAKLLATSLNKEVTSAEDIEETLFKLALFVHHTNTLWLEPQQKLLFKYMREKTITRPMRERIVQLCSNIMLYLQHADKASVKTKKYLGLHSCLLNAQIENLLQDKNRGGGNVDETLKKKICEKQILSIIKAKFG